jgi:hypothetical protein
MAYSAAACNPSIVPGMKKKVRFMMNTPDVMPVLSCCHAGA